MGGAIEELGFVPIDVAYEVRDYYGMVTASFDVVSGTLTMDRPDVRRSRRADARQQIAEPRNG